MLFGVNGFLVRIVIIIAILLLVVVVGSLPVSVSWPSALHCDPCLTHCSPGNVPNPNPGVHPSSILVSQLYIIVTIVTPSNTQKYDRVAQLR